MARNSTATRAAAPAEEPLERPAPSFIVVLPLVATTVRTPQFGAPAVETVQQRLPSRKNLLSYGALAGTAALRLIPWSVAVTDGIGTAIAQR